MFCTKNRKKSVEYKIKLFKRRVGEGEIDDFEVIKLSSQRVKFEYGKNDFESIDFFINISLQYGLQIDVH